MSTNIPTAKYFVRRPSGYMPHFLWALGLAIALFVHYSEQPSWSMYDVVAWALLFWALLTGFYHWRTPFAYIDEEALTVRRGLLSHQRLPLRSLQQMHILNADKIRLRYTNGAQVYLPITMLHPRERKHFIKLISLIINQNRYVGEA
ncbi:hypothetical protein [Eisenibacter elegans]|uniref:hypothetical protein n=1 Tax=Eisenibacter elegans TaxID=997 RepID=UPI00047E8D39|nr:hypothetical protein [Eisenibacter elegans]